MHCSCFSLCLAARARFLSLLLVVLMGGTALAQTFPGKIGLEIEGPNEGARNRAYVDIGRGHRPFINLDGTSAPKDALGWPLSDGKTVVFDIRPVAAWTGEANIDDPDRFMPDFSGTYKCSFTGQGTPAMAEGAATVTNVAYDSGTNTTTFDLNVPAQSPTNMSTGIVVLQFTNTRRTPSSALNTGLTNLRIIRPGYHGTPNQLFTNEFLNSLGAFQYLRLMDWLETNANPGYYGDVGNHKINWDQRKKPDAATQQYLGGDAHGACWEHALLLCNQANKDMWLNIPVNATDEYITGLANLLKNGNSYTNNVGLASHLKIYVEHSNEVWNFSFPQYTYNKLAAVDEATNDPNSPLDNDGTTDQEVLARRRHAKRTRDAVKIFESVFGTNTINSKIFGIYSHWTIQPAQYNATLSWMNSTYGAPANYFYGMGQTVYFNDNAASDTATVTEILNAMRNDSDSHVSMTQQLKSVADSWSLQLVAYEAGPDTGGGSTVNVANRIRAERDPEMKNLIERNARTNWFPNGGDLYTQFAHAGGYSRYGCWGLTEDALNINTYKYQAIYSLTGYAPDAPPGAPTGLTATPGSGQTSLNWTASPGAESYNVKRSSSSGGPYSIVASGITITSHTDTGLTNGNTYYYVVSATNSFGTSGNSNEASVSLTPPAVPTNVAAAAGPSSGRVTVSWSASAGAASYNLYRSTSSGGQGSTPVITAIASTSYVDSGLTNGTTYYYTVTAVNALGESAQSAEVSATPTDSGSISQELWTGISGTAVSQIPLGTTPNQTAALTSFEAATNWADNYGQRARGYLLAPQTGSYTFWIASDDASELWLSTSDQPADKVKIAEITAWTNSREWNKYTSQKSTVISLTAGQRYYIEALMKEGSGGDNLAVGWLKPGQSGTVPSEVIPGSSLQPWDGGTPPAAPTDLAATAGDAQVSLTWSASAGATSYGVYFTTGGNFEPAATGLTATSYVHTNLTNGTQYTYYVTASNGAGESSPSNTVSATPQAGTPSQVADPTFSPVAGTYTSAQSVTISTATSGASIRYTTDGTTPTSTAGTLYSGPIAISSTTTLKAIAFKSGMTDSNVTTGLYTINPPASQTTLVNYVTSDQSGTIPTYQQTARALSINTASEARIDFDTSTPLFTGYPPLRGGVHMVNSAATGTYSTWRLHTDPNSWPNKATTFVASSTSEGSPCTVNVVYVWNKADFAGVGSETVSFDSGSTLNLNIQDWRNGPVRFLVREGTQYYVSEASLSGAGSLSLTDFANNNSAGKRWAPVTLTATSFDLPSNLTFSPTGFANVTQVGWIGSGTDGWYRMWGFDTFSAAGVVGSAPPDTTPPAAPTGLVATSVSSSQIDLDWADNTEPDLAGYNVKRSTTSGGPYATIATDLTASSYSNTGLSASTTYYYVVSAVDASSNESGNSAQASATTQTNPPAAPTGLTATAGDQQVALSWNASSGATSYNVKRSTTSGSGYSTIASPSTTGHTDTNLTNGTTYYYVVSAVNAGGESANSSQASATPSGGCTASAMHVSSIVVTSVNIGQGNKRGQAQVTILDNCGNPVSGATVTGSFTGSLTESGRTGVTNASGVATIQTSGTRKGGVSFTFCVDGVTHSGLTYNSAANVETCDSGS